MSTRCCYHSQKLTVSQTPRYPMAAAVYPIHEMMVSRQYLQEAASVLIRRSTFSIMQPVLLDPALSRFDVRNPALSNNITSLEITWSTFELYDQREAFASLSMCRRLKSLRIGVYIALFVEHVRSMHCSPLVPNHKKDENFTETDFRRIMGVDELMRVRGLEAFAMYVVGYPQTSNFKPGSPRIALLPHISACVHHWVKRFESVVKEEVTKPRLLLPSV